jgi:hypothetical protein
VESKLFGLLKFVNVKKSKMIESHFHPPQRTPLMEGSAGGNSQGVFSKSSEVEQAGRVTPCNQKVSATSQITC